MTTIYYDSAAAGANDGTSKTDAYTSFATAVAALVAAASGSLLLVNATSTETIGASLSATFTDNKTIRCIDFGTDVYATMRASGGQLSGSVSFTFISNPGGYVRISGLKINTTSTSSAIRYQPLSGGFMEVDDPCCILGTTGTNHTMAWGVVSTSNYGGRLIVRNPIVYFGGVNNDQDFGGNIEMYGYQLEAGSAVPIFIDNLSGRYTHLRLEGGDLSDFTTLLPASSSGSNAGLIELHDCELHASVVLTNETGGAGQEIYLFDCAAGDVHYGFAHENGFGQTLLSTAKYNNTDGATPDGSTKYSWAITTKSSASAECPYRSPWISYFNEAVGSGLTPSLEVMRIDSATVYDDDELYSQWMYKGTSSTAQGVFAHDEAAPNATPAAQATGDLDATDWVGESGSTDAFMKLSPGSITPQEVGYIRGRVVFAVPSKTVYLDPQIRIA